MFKFFALSCLASMAAAKFEGFIELTNERPMHEVLQDHEFSMVSFYDSSEKSMAVNKVIGGAKQYFDKMIEEGEWADRDVAWYKVDIEKYPEMMAEEDELIAD